MQNEVTGCLSLVGSERTGLHTGLQIPSVPGTVVLSPSWLDSGFHLAKAVLFLIIEDRSRERPQGVTVTMR